MLRFFCQDAADIFIPDLCSVSTDNVDDRSYNSSNNIIASPKSAGSPETQRRESLIGAAKRSIIIEMSQDIKNLNKTCEHVIAENSVLSGQLELSKNECTRLKATIEDLESKLTEYASEVKNLKLSLESAKNKPQVEEVSTSIDQVGNASKTSKKKKVAIEHTNAQNDDRPLNKYTKYWGADEVI